MHGYVRYTRTHDMEPGGRCLPGPLDLYLVSVVDGVPFTTDLRHTLVSSGGCLLPSAETITGNPSHTVSTNRNLFGWAHPLPGTESVRSVGQV